MRQRLDGTDRVLAEAAHEPSRNVAVMLHGKPELAHPRDVAADNLSSCG